jgi:hypothetical protein
MRLNNLIMIIETSTKIIKMKNKQRRKDINKIISEIKNHQQ